MSSLKGSVFVSFFIKEKWKCPNGKEWGKLERGETMLAGKACSSTYNPSYRIRIASQAGNDACGLLAKLQPYKTSQLMPKNGDGLECIGGRSS